MGTGKTVAGEALAAHLALPFSDNDRAIMDATGLTARDLRDLRGVQVLHKLESRHLLDAVGEPAPSVIGAAASVIENERCRTALQRPDVLTIWLRASAETLAARFHNEDHRPLFGDSPLVFFREQIPVRAPLFSAVSTAVVDVDGRTAAEVVAGVIAAADELLAVRQGVRGRAGRLAQESPATGPLSHQST
jgi:shikimate kinase